MAVLITPQSKNITVGLFGGKRRITNCMKIFHQMCN